MNHFDNAGRERCHRCAKLVFYAQTQAKEAAANAQANGVFLRVYFDEKCSCYHLSSKRSRYATVIPSPVPRQSLSEGFVSATDAERKELAERREENRRRMGQEAMQQWKRDQSKGQEDFFRFLFIVLFLPLTLPFKLFRKIGIPDILSAIFAVIVCLVLIDTVVNMFSQTTPLRNFFTGIFT